MKKSYWENNGKYQKEYDELYDKLVPTIGNCKTLQGELLRATSRIYYDYYNNGMCNNTSGAVNFLIKYNSQFALGITNELNLVYNESNTGGYTSEKLEIPLEKIADVVIKWCAEHPELISNTSDLFDFQDKDYFCEEEDEE